MIQILDTMFRTTRPSPIGRGIFKTIEHLGEEVEFSALATWVSPSPLRLGGLSDHGLFISSSRNEWKFCRLKPKPQFIDWTIETAESVQLMRKSDGVKVWVNYGPGCAWYHGGGNTCHVPYPTLLEEWETVDGRPCGTEVKDD